MNGGLLLLDIEKLRAQPEIIAPEYFKKMIQEFDYIPMTDQGGYHLIRYKHPEKVYMIPCLYNYMSVFAGTMEPQKIQYNTCLSKPYIQHYAGENTYQQRFPLLSKYNDLLKLSFWCWDPAWHHCY